MVEDEVVSNSHQRAPKSPFAPRRLFGVSRSTTSNHGHHKRRMKSNKRVLNKYKRVKSVQHATIKEQPSGEELCQLANNEKRRHCSDSVVLVNENEEKDKEKFFEETHNDSRAFSQLSSSSIFSSTSSALVEDRQSLSVCYHQGECSSRSGQKTSFNQDLQPRLIIEDLTNGTKVSSSSTSSTATGLSNSHDTLGPRSSSASRNQTNMDDLEVEKRNEFCNRNMQMESGKSFEDNDSVLMGPNTTSPKTKNLPNASLLLSSKVNVDLLLEYPFVTLKSFPPAFIQRLGGLVSCRSVKFLDTQELDASVRSSWWQELRHEVRSHARSIACNIVVGYQEDTVIWDDVMILSASGTAAQVDLNFMLNLESKRIFGPPFIRAAMTPMTSATQTSQASMREQNAVDCSLYHLPFSESSLPYVSRSHRCNLCNSGRVPDVLFTSIEPPDNTAVMGKGDLVQAKVVRVKRDLKGENEAKAVSDALPFIEYELHRQLLNKLKVKCMNALFAIRTKLTLSDHLLIGVATATGCTIRALPFPTPPRLVSSATPNWNQSDPHFLQRAQKRLETRIAENARYLGLSEGLHKQGGRTSSSNSNDDVDINNAMGNTNNENVTSKTYEDYNEVDFSVGSKDTCVLEIDDSEDVDILDSLLDPFPPQDTHIFASQAMLGINTHQVVQCCQLFSQVWRGRLHPASRDLNLATQKLLELVHFKLRRLRPLVIAAVDFNIDVSENDGDIQLWAYGTALSLAQPPVEGNKSPSSSSTAMLSTNSSLASVTEAMDDVSLTTSPNFYSLSAKMGNMVHLTPLSSVPGHKIDAYLGNINFFLIRETTSLRESGGMNSFIHSFSAEVMAVARAHVAALGGNALVSLFMAQFVVSQSLHKNQGQCLMHVGGDVVAVSPVLKP